DRSLAYAPVFGPPRSATMASSARMTRVVQVDRGRDGRPKKVTVAEVESHRMTVRIDNWIKGSASDLSLTIGPDGRVEDPAHSTPPANDDVGQMALRMHNWLGRGGPG